MAEIFSFRRQKSYLPLVVYVHIVTLISLNKILSFLAILFRLPPRLRRRGSPPSSLAEDPQAVIAQQGVTHLMTYCIGCQCEGSGNRDFSFHR
ncbi:MAG: hypothetical protein ACFB15_00305 [Cyclobacteriaceae bacterium]